MAKIAQLKMLTKVLEDDLACYEVSEDSFKSELAIAKTEVFDSFSFFIMFEQK